MKYLILILLVLNACADEASVYAPEKQFKINQYEDVVSRETIEYYGGQFKVNTENMIEENWDFKLNFNDTVINSDGLEDFVILNNDNMYVYYTGLDSVLGMRFKSIYFVFRKELY